MSPYLWVSLVAWLTVYAYLIHEHFTMPRHLRTQDLISLTDRQTIFVYALWPLIAFIVLLFLLVRLLFGRWLK